jgi:hypothetical protein
MPLLQTVAYQISAPQVACFSRGLFFCPVSTLALEALASFALASKGCSLAAHLSGAVMDKPRKGKFFVFGGSDFGSHE